MSLNRKGRVWKDVPSILVTTECQLSGLTTPMTETGGMENVSESQEANWEEMSGWFWGTKKLRWKGWKKKWNLFILHSQESRGGRTNTLLACWTLSLYACKRVWKKQLNSLQTSTKHFLFMRTVIKFQFDHFFKLPPPTHCWCVGVFVWCHPGVSGERLWRSVVTAAVFL